MLFVTIRTLCRVVLLSSRNVQLCFFSASPIDFCKMCVRMSMRSSPFRFVYFDTKLWLVILNFTRKEQEIFSSDGM